MGHINKQKIISSTIQWLGEDDNGYWITLNGLTKDRIKFEQDLNKVTMWLNDYCYGRKYQRGESRFKIVAGIETGSLNGMLHCHIVMTNIDDTDRSYQEINAFIRKHWYLLIGASGSIFGNMVDVQRIDAVENTVGYAFKGVTAASSIMYL
jgi:hypothetical protein